MWNFDPLDTSRLSPSVSRIQLCIFMRNSLAILFSPRLKIHRFDSSWWFSPFDSVDDKDAPILNSMYRAPISRRLRLPIYLQYVEKWACPSSRAYTSSYWKICHHWVYVWKCLWVRIQECGRVFELRVEMWLYTNLHIEMWACLNSDAGNVGVSLSSYIELRAYSNSYAEMWVRLLVYKRKYGCVFVF